MKIFFDDFIVFSDLCENMLRCTILDVKESIFPILIFLKLQLIPTYLIVQWNRTDVYD